MDLKIKFLRNFVAPELFLVVPGNIIYLVFARLPYDKVERPLPIADLGRLLLDIPTDKFIFLEILAICIFNIH